jgi:hypothetical protein
MDSKEAVQILMNDGIAFATTKLGEFGEFHPYGRTLSKELVIVDIPAFDGEDNPDDVSFLELLENGLREKVISDSDIAIATFTNVGLREENGNLIDAVQVGLEHLDGYAINVYFPYTIGEEGVLYDELIAMERSATVYARTSEKVIQEPNQI